MFASRSSFVPPKKKKACDTKMPFLPFVSFSFIFIVNPFGLIRLTLSQFACGCVSWTWIYNLTLSFKLTLLFVPIHHTIYVFSIIIIRWTVVQCKQLNWSQISTNLTVRLYLFTNTTSMYNVQCKRIPKWMGSTQFDKPASASTYICRNNLERKTKDERRKIKTHINAANKS